MTRALVACLTLVAAVSLGAQTPTRPATAPPPVKIAFVSSRTIMQSTPGYAAADSALNRDIQAGRDEIARLQAQMDSAVRAFDQQSIALSPAAKQAKQRELQQLQDRYTQRGTELNDRIQQRQQELFGPINARIRAVIDGLRAEGNYAMIFDADASGGGLISADPTLDITAKVLQRLSQAQ